VSYVRLFQVVQDFVLGVQTVNQARDNNEDLLSVLDARHEISLGVVETSPLKAFGRHDDSLIPRAVVTLHVSTDPGAPTPVLEVSGPLLQAEPIHRATGVWVFQLRGAWTFGASATPLATAAVDYGATAVCSGSTLYVTTWATTGGAFALTDLDFSVAIWGKP